MRGIHLAVTGLGTDEATIWRLLENTYSDERAMIAQTYFRTYGKTLTQVFYEEFSDSTIWGNELDRTLRLYRHGRLTLAERIYFAVQGWGTDDPAVRRAMAELRRMTPAEIAAVQAEYGQLAPPFLVGAPNGGMTSRPAVLADAFRGDLCGGFRDDAMAALDGQITTVQQYYELAQRRYNYERVGVSNWLGNLVSSVNTQGGNLEATWDAIDTAYRGFTASQKAAHIDTQVAFRSLVAQLDQDVDFYRGFRGAAITRARNFASRIEGDIEACAQS